MTPPSKVMADVQWTLTLHTVILPVYLSPSEEMIEPGSGWRKRRAETGPRYSTFNTSFIASFSVFLGKAPTAICGLLCSGTKRMLGML